MAELTERCPHTAVYASAAEAPFIRGERKSLRLAQAEALHNYLPESEKEGSLQIQRLFASVPKGRVDKLSKDGDLLPWCGGVRIIDTSGHTPGHISLYHPESKTLIAGDALALENGRLQIPNPPLDMDAARRSVRRLAELDIDTVICCHGGVFEGDAKTALGALADSPEAVLASWVQAFNRADADALAAMYHEDAVNHQVANEPPPGGRPSARCSPPNLLW